MISGKQEKRMIMDSYDTFMEIMSLPGGFGVLYVLVRALVSEYELSITIGPVTYIISIALTFGVSLFVGWMVAGKNRKIDMVEALKGAE